jgi:16S rRNA (adenine1518-N6/adenine1519-N6)-dimethyltransferase
MDVNKELFEPIPKVDSAVIKITRLNKPAFESDTKKLFRLVKAGFGEKRKMLRNSLAGGLGIETSMVLELLETSVVAPTARAQELSMQDWENLYNNCLSAKII